MGSFYTNITLVGPGQAEVVSFLREIGRECFVSPSINGRTIVYDKECDKQDAEVLEKLSSQLSREFSCPAWAVLNHDDDILIYFLYDQDKKIDSYDSCPGYFEMESDKDYVGPEGGNSSLLCAAFKVLERADEVEAILHKHDALGDKQGYVFAFERHKDLAKALGIHEGLARLGYDYVERGDADELMPELKMAYTGIISLERVRSARQKSRQKIVEEEQSILRAIIQALHPILQALHQGNMAQVEALLDQDPQLINLKDNSGESLIKLAVTMPTGFKAVAPLSPQEWKDEKKRKEHLSLIAAASAKNLQILISRGADVNELSGPNKDTALHRAAIMGYPDMVKVLLENHADPNLKNKFGQTPLHVMIGGIDMNLLPLDVYMPDPDGRRAAICKLLLEAGADPSIKDFKGNVPLDCVQRANMTEIVKLLKSRSD